MTTLIICAIIAALLPYLAKAPVAYAMQKDGGYDNTTSFNLQGQTPKQFQTGDWSILCNKTCLASQLLLSEDKQLKYSATVSTTDEQNLLQMKLVFPLGIYLPANIGLMVNGMEKSIPVISCIPSGCVALLIMNSEIQKAMLKTTELKIRFFSTDTRENEIIYSLKGFKEALALVN